MKIGVRPVKLGYIHPVNCFDSAAVAFTIFKSPLSCGFPPSLSCSFPLPSLVPSLLPSLAPSLPLLHPPSLSSNFRGVGCVKVLRVLGWNVCVGVLEMSESVTTRCVCVLTLENLTILE